MASFEIVNSIQESMSRTGALNVIRAQLKASILEVMTNENLPHGRQPRNEKASTFVQDKMGQVSLDLVTELLEILDLKHTLGALNAELGKTAQPVDRETLARQLQIPAEYHSADPLLMILVKSNRSPGLSPKAKSPLQSIPGARPTSPSLVIAPLDSSKTSSSSSSLSQRRAISLSVTPEKSNSPSSNKSPSLSPVSPQVGSGDFSKSWSQGIPQVENRGRMGVLNPLPSVPTLSHSKGAPKLGELLISSKGSSRLNLTEYGSMTLGDAQQVAAFISQSPYLEGIAMVGCGMNDAMFTVIFESIRQLTRLGDIDLSRNKLTTVDPRLFIMPSLKECILAENKLPPVLAEATFAELKMYGKQKTQSSQSLERSTSSIKSSDLLVGPEEQELEEELDVREVSSSFEMESPDYKRDGTLRKARNPISSLSRVVEVQPKGAAERTEPSTSVQRLSGGGGARSKSGWGSAPDDRETDDGDFVFTEESEKTSPAAGTRRLNPLNNRTTRSPPQHASPVESNPGKNNSDDLLEQSMNSFADDTSDIFQRSHVSNQDEEDVPLAGPRARISPKPKAAVQSSQQAEYANDEYGDDFEEIEEDMSIGESSYDSSHRFDDSTELSPTIKSARLGSLSRTRSGFIDTVQGKKLSNVAAPDSEDEADQEAHEESSPTMTRAKGTMGQGLQPLITEHKKGAALPPAQSGWAGKPSSGNNNSKNARKDKNKNDMVFADMEDQSIASEDIDAFELSVGGGESDCNGSFSFMHDESVASHKSKARLSAISASTGGAKKAINKSAESADVDFSVTETELSTSGLGLFEGYDYTTSALPPVKSKGKSGW